MLSKLQRIPLQYKIMLLTTIMVCFVLIGTGLFAINSIANKAEEDVGHKALAIGQIIAQVPLVKTGIESPNPSEILQPFAERWQSATGAAFIVIANMQQIRLTHPIPENIGTPLAELYRDPVLQGQEYVYIGKGSLAPSLRANVPVFDQAGTRQIGFVSVGFYLNDVYQMAEDDTKKMAYAFIGVLLLCAAGSSFVAKSVKKSIYGLEPYEIGALLKEREATLNAIHEGIVAIDIYGNICLLNDEAIDILGVHSDKVIGKHIRTILPQNHLDSVIRYGTPRYNEEQRVNNTIILANSVPILVGDTVTGAVVTFRDRTEISSLAEEMTGIHRFVDLLRAQAHEFKNKMHTVAGLIQLKNYDQAVDLIVESYANSQGSFEELKYQISDVVTVGLLAGKIIRANELGVEMSITKETRMEKLPGRCTSGDMVIILGNLTENAIEAVSGCQNKKIAVHIGEDSLGTTIKVRNTGPWVNDEITESIYRRGVSTKGANRGLGLALVMKKIKLNNGSITHHNLPEGGVEFIITIPWQE